MAYYSFPKKKIKILKSVKLMQLDVSSEVILTAIDVKCNFTQQINANKGKMLNIVTKLLERGLKTRHFIGLFLRTYNLAIRPGLKYWELVNNMKTKLSAFFF